MYPKLNENNPCVLVSDRATWWRGLKGLEHLENRISRKPSVHTPNTMITKNGCKVTLIFAGQSKPEIRKDVADMLLTAFEKRRQMV